MATLTKGTQISAPSCKEIKDKLKQVWRRTKARRNFLGFTVRQQALINAVILWLDDQNHEKQDQVIDAGLALLKKILDSDEPSVVEAPKVEQPTRRMRRRVLNPRLPGRRHLPRASFLNAPQVQGGLF
jgi:hypothetical protein